MRKPTPWTPEQARQFMQLCGIFCTKSEICNIMGIADHRTLDARIAEAFPETPTWAEAFEHFSGTGRASLRRKQFELAMEGDRVMLIFLGKNYLGQSDDGAKAEPERKRDDESPLAAARKRSAARMAVV